jgi:DNA repair exonuclease SbcCD ATPase subunit
VDIQYVHGVKSDQSPRRRKQEQQWEESQWKTAQYQSKTSRKATQSPRPRGKTPKGKKGKPQNYGVPALDPPWQGSETAPVQQQPTSSGTEQAEQYLTELVAALETSDQPITADVQEVIDKTKQSPATAKSVSQAFQKLEKKRKQLVSAQQARQNLHQSWNTYLDESVKRWKTFAEDFAKKDQELEKRVLDAKDAMQDAKDKHDEAKAALDKQDAEVLKAQVEAEEISDDNMEESPQEKLASAAEIQEGINTMIQTLDNGRVRPTEIEEERNSKKARLEGNEQSSFGSDAMKPFGKPDKKT